MKKITLMVFVLMLVQIGFSQVKVGDKAPDFNLKNIDGKMVKLSDFNTKSGVVVIFTCNHCPYAKAYEDRIIALQKQFGAEYPVVAINPNADYEGDDFPAMKLRAKEKGFNFPYLYDADQSVANLYSAKKTPHLYLLAKKGDRFEIVYIGAIDDNYTDATKVKTKYVENAITALKEGKEINPKTTVAIGCSVKYK